MYRKNTKRIRNLALLGAIILILPQMLLLINSIKPKPHFEYSQEDVTLLGNVMYAEINLHNKYGRFLENPKQSEIKYTYKLVGSVVLHRLESPLFSGETIEQIVCLPYQYPLWEEGYNIYNLNAPPEVYKWAEEILRNGPIGPEGLVFESCFKQGRKTYFEINGIYFCLY